jgi:hypothetical protein
MKWDDFVWNRAREITLAEGGNNKARKKKKNAAKVGEDVSDSQYQYPLLSASATAVVCVISSAMVRSWKNEWVE